MSAPNKRQRQKGRVSVNCVMPAQIQWSLDFDARSIFLDNGSQICLTYPQGKKNFIAAPRKIDVASKKRCITKVKTHLQLHSQGFPWSIRSHDTLTHNPSGLLSHVFCSAGPQTLQRARTVSLFFTSQKKSAGQTRCEDVRHVTSRLCAPQTAVSINVHLARGRVHLSVIGVESARCGGILDQSESAKLTSIHLWTSIWIRPFSPKTHPCCSWTLPWTYPWTHPWTHP